MKSISKTLGYLVIGLTALATSAYADRLYVPAVRELPELRSATSRHFLLADGTFSAECSLEPMNYRATDGTWQPIDTNLNPTTKNAFALANESNTLKTYLPNTGGGWVRVEAGQGAVSFRPLGVADGTSSVKGNRLDFADVGRNMTLSYEALPGRLKETLTISAPIGAPSFSYALRPEGLAAREKSDGSVALVDDAGSVVLTVESPWMQDADGHRSTDLVVALTPQGADYVYTLTPDPAWLANARYPVVIDPSLTATFANPGAYAGYDYPTYTYLATPNAYVGATSAFQVGAFRPFLQFDASSLPLDAEVDSALLQYTVTSALNLNTITIEAREFPFLVEPTDIVWSQDSGRNDLMIGQDLSSFAAGIPKTYTFNGGSSFPFYDYYGLDVTSIVSSWADKRYIKDGNDQFQPLMLNLVLHDTADGPNGYGSGNHLGIFCSTSGSGPMVLNINYATRGWYMSQGNRRHTGRTQYSISPDATRKWWAALPTGTGAYPTFELNAAPVAVPNSASPTSGFPVIYAAVTDYADTASTRVYRIEDLGIDRNISSTVLNNFQVSGTPLVLPGSSSTVADKVILTGNGTGDDLYMAKVIRLDAVTSGGTTTWSQVWIRPFEFDETYQSEIKASPSYYGGYTTYTLHTTNGPTQQHTNTGGAIIVAMNVLYQYEVSDGYMRALSLADGKNVWGHVDESGALVDVTCDSGPPPLVTTPGGLYKLRYPATHSSPAIGGLAAIANDESCVNNARNVTNGAWLWQNTWDYSIAVESSPSLFNGRVFHGETLDGVIVSMDWQGDSVTGFESSGANIWTTGAFSSDHQAVIFGDDSGQVFAANTDLVAGNPNMYEKWCNPDVAPYYAIRCSPLVAGVPGSNQANVFVGADDGFVHVLNAVDGEPVNGADQFSVLIGNGLDLDDNPLPLNGAIRASMAAYQGRLYVLTTGNPVAPWPTLYCFN